MKITDLQLEQYGIYQNASWKPSTDSLNIVMGENESGKTTMLRFIRDMMFGFGRGKWQGRKGSMGFTRSDGQNYRVFQDGKNRWFENDNHIKIQEELPKLWWHGLNRHMYESIFAVGLEDLQGISFLGDNSVKSRFFMLQGGDKLSDVKNKVEESKSELLVASPQGKRRINRLLTELGVLKEKLDLLSNQEKDFSDLQKRQKLLKDEIENLQKQIEANKAEDKKLDKRLGAWEYYKRARDVKHQLELSSQVKMFPTNGKEQWNHLMNRMKVIHDQKISLKEKLDDYKPMSKEDIIPWAGLSQELESLYTDLGQWKQTIKDAEKLDREKEIWEIDYTNLGYGLSLWDRPLDTKEPCVNVDWEEGRKLAQSVGVRNNELHFWEQREPVVEAISENIESGEAIQTEEEWKEIESTAVQIEGIVTRCDDIMKQVGVVSAQSDKKYTFWFILGVLLILGTAAGLGAFFMAMQGYVALYGATGSLALAVISFMINNKLVHKKGSQLKVLNDELEQLKAKKEEISKNFPVAIPTNTEELRVFHNAMQQRRSEFYKNQAQRQAQAWKRETIKKQQLQHQKWEEEGKELRKKEAEAIKDWSQWLSKNKLPKTSAESLSVLQEQWQKIYSEEGKGKILDLRLEQIDGKLDEFAKRAESIIATTKLAYPVTPESIADIYEENHRKTLEWEAVQERNNQHYAYQKDMEKLNDAWESCQKEMDTLLSLVNAKNAEEFAEKVNAHEHHDQLKKEWETIKQDLRLYAGSEEEFKSLWETLESGQYDEWMQKHQELKEAIQKDTERLGELQKNQGAVENEIFRLAGDTTITQTLQQKKEIETEIKNGMEEWATYLMIEYILGEAQKNYESGKQPLILKQANEFLQSMTNGKYSLQLNEAGDDVDIVDGQHHTKGANIWSSGTGDQVYLAIRLAMALAFGDEVESLPVVLDDVFVRFDETRQRETLKFLMELAKKQQIFLFTCHAQTMRIAQEVGASLETGEFIHLKSGTIAHA